MRADRLVSIVLWLQHLGKASARELAQKLEVSERTILRDMDALSAAGIPVYAERGAGGGWSLSEGYRTTLTGLKKEELQSLLLAPSAGGALSALGMNADYETAALKLLAALPPTLQKDAKLVRERIHVDGAGWHQSGESFPYLSLIQEAVWAERKLAIHYPRDDRLVKRIVEPLGLVVKSGIWYAVAAADGELRSFRISRIEDAVMLDEPFVRPDAFELAAYWERSTEAFRSSLPTYPATLSFARDLLPKLRRMRYAQVGPTRPATGRDNWLEADIDFQTLDSARDIVLGCGAQAVVLQPEELRDAVASEAAAMAALYFGNKEERRM